MTQSDIRRYEAKAQTTNTFGRVLCRCRDHHFIVDGPVQNGCPGEEVTPGEYFLAGIAACGVELLQVFARQEQIPLESVHVDITGKMDRGNPVRPDVTLFNSVRLQFRLGGVSIDRGQQLVESFKGR